MSMYKFYDADACEHDVNTVPDVGDFEMVEIDGCKYWPVDRDALLGLTEEAEKSAWYFALDHDEDELRDRLTEAAEDFSDMARRIREACGVTE